MANESRTISRLYWLEMVHSAEYDNTDGGCDGLYEGNIPDDVAKEMIKLDLIEFNMFKGENGEPLFGYYTLTTWGLDLFDLTGTSLTKF